MKMNKAKKEDENYESNSQADVHQNNDDRQ